MGQYAPFWQQVNNANSAYFGAISSNFHPILTLGHLFLQILDPALHINDPCLILCKIWYMNGSIFQYFPNFEPKFSQNRYMNGSLYWKLVYVWVHFSGVTAGGGGRGAEWYFSPGGRVLPLMFVTRNLWWPTGKRKARKNWKEKKENLKRNVVNWKWKGKCMKLYMKMSRGLFETTEICLRFTKMQIPTGKKHFTLGKIRKSDFLKIFLLHYLARSYQNQTWVLPQD